MRVFTSALCTTMAIGLLAGCAGNIGSNNTSPLGISAQTRSAPISVFDDATPPRLVSVLHSLVPDAKRKRPKTGTYVSEFYGPDLLAYRINNEKDKKPICTVKGVADVNGVGIDGKGNLMEPDGGTATLNIYQGPTICGKLAGSIPDPYGQPADASSPDALTGTIVVSDLADGTLPGNIAICTLSAGCTTELTNHNIYHAGGVAMSNSGDCWVDAKTALTGGGNYGADLIYFKGCAGTGRSAKGFKSTYYGSIDIDNSGNLVIIDDMAEDVYVYKGCDPNCKVVGGPFALKGESFFGALNKSNTQYTAVDRTDAVVDVYSYSPTKIKFLYSYDNGLAESLLPDGVAVSPRSQQ